MNLSKPQPLKALLVLALGAIAMPAGVIFSDGDFSSGWTDSMIINQNMTSSSYASSNPQGFGNTGPYRQETHTMVQNSTSSLAAGVWRVLNSSANYDPSSQGAITSLDFSYDLIGIAGGNVGYGLALLQNGRNYRAYFGDFGGARWTPYSHSGLTALTFIELLDFGPYPHLDLLSHPDFSSTGSNIQFGYNVNNSISGTWNVTSGIDNWRVDINSAATPEPASFFLAGSALIGLAALRARRKRSPK